MSSQNKVQKVYNIFQEKKGQRLDIKDIKKIQEVLHQHNMVIDDCFSKGDIKFDDFMSILDDAGGSFEWTIVERHISNEPFLDKKRVVAKISGSCQMFTDQKWNNVNGLKLELIDSNVWHFSTPNANWMEINGEKLNY